MNKNGVLPRRLAMRIQHGLYTNIYKTEERHVPFILLVEIGDFVSWDESKKRFLYVCPTVFTAGHHKDMFFA